MRCGLSPLLEIRAARDAADLAEIGDLFEEHRRELCRTSPDAGCCLAGYEAEIATLPGDYGPPEGCLLVALQRGMPAGCAALRPLPDGRGEIGRLYVRPAFRRQGLGRLLLHRLLREARNLGYPEVRLDTLPSLREAGHLVESLGFREMDSDRDGSPAGVRRLGLKL